MPEILFHLKPAAQAALNERKQQIMAWRRLNIIKTDTARDLLAKANEEFFRSEMMDPSAPERSVGVTCPDCSRLHIMSADVTLYKCPCNPHLERRALLHRTIDGGVEIGAIPALVRAASPEA